MWPRDPLQCGDLRMSVWWMTGVRENGTYSTHWFPCPCSQPSAPPSDSVHGAEIKVRCRQAGSRLRGRTGSFFTPCATESTVCRRCWKQTPRQEMTLISYFSLDEGVLIRKNHQTADSFTWPLFHVHVLTTYKERDVLCSMWCVFWFILLVLQIKWKVKSASGSMQTKWVFLKCWPDFCSCSSR